MFFTPNKYEQCYLPPTDYMDNFIFLGAAPPYKEVLRFDVPIYQAPGMHVFYLVEELDSNQEHGLQAEPIE